jgi:thymidine phosphorylase
MKNETAARALAQSMVSIGTLGGMRTEAFITDMEAPLGHAVGNSLEIIECIETLKGRGPRDLMETVERLASRMVVLSGIDADEGSAACRVRAVLAAGEALQVFARMVERQGGDPRVIDDYRRLPVVSAVEPLLAPRDGFVRAMRADAIGWASHALGAGRDKVGDSVDHAVGIRVHARPGDAVERGQVLLELHHRDRSGLDAARTLCNEAVEIGDARPAARATLLGEIR